MRQCLTNTGPTDYLLFGNREYEKLIARDKANLDIF